jgi:ATP-dependent DNA helicase RecQ
MEYAGARTCRHARIADYFGEQGVARTCGACDNCLDHRQVATTEVVSGDVNAALACVVRFDNHLGGVRIASILHGASDAWTSSRPWIAELPWYGALRAWEMEAIRDLLERLVELGCVSRGHGEKPTLGITTKGRAVLSGASTLDVDVRTARGNRTGRSRRHEAGGAPADAMSAEVAARFEALRRWRLETARRDEVPPFVIFHDRTLAEIARRHPSSLAGLAAIPGVGPAKLVRYAGPMLSLLRDLGTS